MKPRGRSLGVALAACSAAVLLGCRSVEGPFGRRDALGRLAPPEAPDAARYVVDSELQPDPRGSESPGTALPAGLRASVVESPGVRGTAEAHAAVDDVALPVPLGEAVWGNVAYKSPATLDPVWNGARVAVEWVVVVRHRGSCFVEVEAVPRLLHACGSVARLDEFRVVRRLSLDDALAFSLDPSHPAAAGTRALFGARAQAWPADTPLRLVLRVRGGA